MPKEMRVKEVKTAPDNTAKIEHLEAQKRELMDEIAKVHEGHAKEREELQERVQKLEETITELKQAQDKRDEVHGSKSTLVLPPNDLPAQQPAGASPAPGANGGGAERRKRMSWW